MENARLFAGLLRTAAERWNRDRVPRMAAALSYYSIFALAPLLMLGVAAASLIASRREAAESILDLAGQFLTERAVDALRPAVFAAMRPASTARATALALATTFYGASGLFVQLQDALNSIFQAPPPDGDWLRHFLRRRLTSLLLVAAAALVLIAAPLLNAVVEGSRSQSLGLLISVAAETAIFAVLFKALPDARLSWRHVLPGATLTALLFTVGQWVLGEYFAHFGYRSLYGAAGSLVIVLLWVHFSAQILLFGAEFIQAHRDLVPSNELQ